MDESIYYAKPEEGKEISRILDASTNNGLIDLLYTRRPDAYSSYMKEPGEARVFVTRKDGKVITTCSELIRNVYIGGEESKAAYICGFKKDHEYTGGAGISAKLVRSFVRDDIDSYFFCVLADNNNAKDMFEKNMGIISSKKLKPFKTFIFSPKVRFKAPKHSFAFRQANKGDIPKLFSFLNSEGKKKDLFPIIKSIDDYYNLHIEDFYVLMDGDEILGAGALWNSTPYKQYVVKKYSMILKIARVANPIISALGYPKLPKEKQSIDFPMLSFFVIKNDNLDNYLIFLDEIRKEVGKKYGMFAFDVVEDHYARKVLDKLPNVGFVSSIYELKFPWSKQKTKLLNPNSLATESGML